MPCRSIAVSHVKAFLCFQAQWSRSLVVQTEAVELKEHDLASIRRVTSVTPFLPLQVWRIAFCPFTEGALVTSGAGHVRFWMMARTFTGLKLQGQAGRFGAVDASDTAGFAELPSRKVHSYSFFLAVLALYTSCLRIEENEKDR